MKTQMDLLSWSIETKQFSRVGGNEIVSVDFRIICATNKDLEEAVRPARYREDLSTSSMFFHQYSAAS